MELDIKDCRSMSAQEIVDYMIKLNPSLNGPIKRLKVYVGATGNIAERLRRHNASKAIFVRRQPIDGWRQRSRRLLVVLVFVSAMLRGVVMVQTAIQYLSMLAR